MSVRVSGKRSRFDLPHRRNKAGTLLQILKILNTLSWLKKMRRDYLLLCGDKCNVYLGLPPFFVITWPTLLHHQTTSSLWFSRQNRVPSHVVSILMHVTVVTFVDRLFKWASCGWIYVTANCKPIVVIQNTLSWIVGKRRLICQTAAN